MPRVEKAYATWHERGLEVLGISSDQEARTLEAYLTRRAATPTRSPSSWA
jgi:hypothetical protein